MQLHPEYKLYTAIIGPDDGLYEDLDIADVYNNTNSDDDIEDPVPHLMLFNWIYKSFLDQMLRNEFGSF